MKSDRGAGLGELSQKEKALQEQIRELKDFVAHGPERERQALEERMSTLPPPSEIEDRRREREFLEQVASRRQIANARRAQASNGFLLVLLLLAIVTIAAWIYRVVMGGTV